MKKRLLFLVVCALLLLLVTAAPAAAVDKIYYAVVIDFHDTTSPAWVLWVNETQWSFGVLRAVPRSATDVRVTETVGFVNSGNLAAFTKAFFQKMTVSYLDSRGGPTVIASCDESTCQAYWGEPYPLNNWMGDDPAYWLYPYNPKIGAGMWSADWMVPLLPQPNPGGVTLRPGKYAITYTDMLAHVCADPMYPGRVPGGEGYPPIGGPWDYWYPAATFAFTVR
jgi:hypothetical protein